MSNEDYRMSFDAERAVVRIVIGKSLTEAIYLAAYATLKRVIASRGPSSVILDTSAVEDFTLSAKFLRNIVDMTPAIPAGKLRVVVAPQAVTYGAARLVQTLRSTTPAPVVVVHTLDEAYAVVGAVAADFVAIDGI
jgi:hypothetical protein